MTKYVCLLIRRIESHKCRSEARLEEDATLSVCSRKIASGGCTADGRASRFPHQQMASMQSQRTVSLTMKRWEWPATVFSLRIGQHVSFAYLLVHIVSPEA
jgi:hypothetical protein